VRAIRLVKSGAALEAQEIPVPNFGSGDVLIRVGAAGICHSDAHYRAGISQVNPLPLTLGHEVAGTVEAVGAHVSDFQKGNRVCVHYLATCGECLSCRGGHEQFCPNAKMIGKHRDGGYAEFLVVPAQNVFRLPEAISFEEGAILMCSSATSFHALNKARLQSGETVAIFGIGGLGVSAVQLAFGFGAAMVFAVDVNSTKLKIAESLGAIPISASGANPVGKIRELTEGRGVDVALELVGLPLTMRQAVQSLAALGRAAVIGLTRETFEIAPYPDLINKEAEVIGVSDHLAAELPDLLELAGSGRLNLKRFIRVIPLEPRAVNHALDSLDHFGEDVRVVIKP
jgi:2-desacetyl-2-hydroxyethyl bacteriochlorophyllide A dehydrogenase